MIGNCTKVPLVHVRTYVIHLLVLISRLCILNLAYVWEMLASLRSATVMNSSGNPCGSLRWEMISVPHLYPGKHSRFCRQNTAVLLGQFGNVNTKWTGCVRHTPKEATVYLYNKYRCGENHSREHNSAGEEKSL